ncbi:hypothetical protein NDU88_002424 [Pleurodeles waltl]|uniref:Uncharacterized protein n=1 Tax=Pleurodeles waltl TaxID=8319 RepID=A0AAV7UYU8_PLEWA|nr:hypothetical protein NDU88_002424 [Pleurodeles waltl]
MPQRELRGRALPETVSRDYQTSDLGIAQRVSMGPAYSAQILAQMAASVIKDHEYGSFASLAVPVSFTGPSTQGEVPSSSSSQSLDSDHVQDDPKPLGNLKRKTHNLQEGNQKPHTLSFDPENIFHPHSTEWNTCVEEAHYMKDRLRKGFGHDVRSTLCSECRCSSLLGKVVDTPELDPNMATFIKRFSKKGPRPSMEGSQDKLLDISGPIMKILELAVQAKETSPPLDLQTVLEWAQ